MTGLTDNCDTLGDLLGAYAIDALDPAEAASVVAHLPVCPRCAQEVESHRQTIGLLAASGGDAPDRVWDRIASSTSSERDAPRPVPLRPVRRPTPRRRPLRALAVAAAIAATVAVTTQTIRISHLDHKVGQLSAAAQQQGGFQGAAAALLDPATKHLLLTSTGANSRPIGQLLIRPSGAAYLIATHVAPLPSSATYQLWSVIAGHTISVGLLGSQPITVAFAVDPNVSPTAYLVTVEPAGGVITPTGSPVARATL